MGNCCLTTSSTQDGNYYLRNLSSKILHSIEAIPSNIKNSQIIELINVLAMSYIGKEEKELEYGWKFICGKDANKLTRDQIILMQSYFFVIYCLYYGVIYAIKNQENKYVGIMLTFPPGTIKQGRVFTEFKAFIVKCKIVKLTKDNFNPFKHCQHMKERMKTYMKQLYAMHQKHANEDHWYLQHIGVLPQYQSQNYGSKLMKVFTALLDKYNVIGYLESNGNKNRRFFGKSGFKVVEKLIPNIEGRLDLGVLNYDGGTSIMINEPWCSETQEESCEGSIEKGDIVSY